MALAHGHSDSEITGEITREVTERERMDIVARLRRLLPFVSDPDTVTEITTTQRSGMAIRDLELLTAYAQAEQQPWGLRE